MIDAAKQALEALQDIDRLLRNMTGHSFSKVVIAIETLQAAIKQAEAAQQDDHKEQGE